MALGQGQQLHSAWMLSLPITAYADDLFLTQFAPQNTSSIGAVVMNNWWFGTSALVYSVPSTPGPGISPFLPLMFRGLSPYSNFIANLLVPLTGQSIATATGSVSLNFAGQSITSGTGILTPSISHALSANNWFGATLTIEGLGPQLNSAWMLDIEVPYADDLLLTQFLPQNTQSAGAAVFNNWWFGSTAGGQGQWINALGQANGWVGPGFSLVTITMKTGAVTPFGVPSASIPAFVPQAGPGPGPFTNTTFEPQTFGYGFTANQPLTGSAITSTQGVPVPTTTAALTGVLIGSATGTLGPVVGNVAPLIGQSISSFTGNIVLLSIDMPLTGQTVVSNTGTLTFTIPPGPGGDLASTIEALINAGLIPQVYYTFSNTVAAGFVISLTPPVGTLVPPNTAVVVLASTGPGGTLGAAVVPNLIGLYWKDATDALEFAELSLDKYLFQISSAPEGTVVAQNIAAGTNVTPGTIVQLTLSAGPVKVIPQIPVP